MSESYVSSMRGAAAGTDHHLPTQLERAIDYLVKQQQPAGFVRGDVIWSPVITAQYLLTAYMTGMTVPEQRQSRFLHHFRVTQARDGSWGLHPESDGYVFVSALVYVAIRLLGISPEDDICHRARNWLRQHGGVEHIPGWGRFWLGMLNLYGYDGIQPVLPELWLLPKILPLHPSRLYCHTRLIYLGFSYLYAVRFQIEVNPLIRELRAELYNTPYEQINFASYLNTFAPTDVSGRPTSILRLMYACTRMYERRRPAYLRRRALQHELELVVLHQRQNDYAAISPVNGLLNVLVLHHARHPDFARSFEGIDYWAWNDDVLGERLNGAHSHTWDTAFTVQAICQASAVDRNVFFEKAAQYFKSAQLQKNIPGAEQADLDRALGGFCFSDKRHRWPVSDCTAETLSALCYLHDRVGTELQIEPTMLIEGVRFILSRQNTDGGFSSFERRRGSHFLEQLNPSEMFRNCMVEHSYVECTGSCLQALHHVLQRFAPLLPVDETQALRRALRRGVVFLRRRQQPDGSWPGFWGINYTYGTLFGVSGLLAGGVPHDDPAIMKACQWLVEARLPDGGWGESWRSCVEDRPVPHERSQVIMTSWAIITLLRAHYRGRGAQEAIDDGVQLLLERQLPNGDWPQESVSGVFFGTAMLHYCLYKNYFPIMALGLYKKAGTADFASSASKRR